MTAKRMEELDALRGLAAMAVVLFHYTTRYSEMFGRRSELWFDVPWGHLGVQLFFGISGFVICMTLDRTRSLIDFAVSRASRLYPAYWAGIILTTATVNLAAMDEFVRFPAEVGLNATMLQSFVGVRAVDGVYWTLAVELTFYCAMAALWKLRLLKSIELILLMWMCFKWVWSFAPSVLGFEPSWLVGTLLIQDHIPFFAIGIAAYRLKSCGGERRLPYVVLGGALVTVGVCDDLDHLVVALIGTAAFVAIALRRVPLLGAKPLVWLGTVSYSLYLLHQFIGFAILQKLEGSGTSPAIAILLTVGAMLALASGVTYLVERPALRAARKWYALVRAASSSPAERLRAE